MSASSGALPGRPSSSGSRPVKDHLRATDVLANERTYLAYLRTALSFIAFGFVVARFALFTRELAGLLHLPPGAQHLSTTFGTVVAGFGAVVAVYGGYRYVATARALAGDRVEAMSSFAAIVGAIAVMLLGILVGVGLVAFR